MVTARKTFCFFDGTFLKLSSTYNQIKKIAIKQMSKPTLTDWLNPHKKQRADIYYSEQVNSGQN